MSRLVVGVSGWESCRKQKVVAPDCRSNAVGLKGSKEETTDISMVLDCDDSESDHVPGPVHTPAPDGPVYHREYVSVIKKTGRKPQAGQCE